MSGNAARTPPPRVRVQAGCKINLWLHITGVRADGYHEIDSLFWPLSEPCDTLEIAPIDEHTLRMACTSADVDVTDNTLTRAYAAYTAVNPLPFGLAVALKKRIPAGAGLGGGSSDAAVVLRYLNAHAPEPLPEDGLAAVALGVGADVPFFLCNTPCRVQGIGEKITPVEYPEIKGLSLVLLCPQIAVSTPWAYRAYDSLEKNKNTAGRLTSGQGQDKSIVSDAVQFVNDLEEPVFNAYPKLGMLKTKLLQNKAVAAFMSGSGSSIAGLFLDARATFKASESFAKFGLRVFTTVL